MIACYPHIEARVLTSMICIAGALELCDELECADVSDMRHVVVLWGIRRAQQTGPVDIDSVLDGIETMCEEQFIPEAMDKVNAKFVANMMQTAPGPFDLETIRLSVSMLKDGTRLRARMIAISHERMLKKFEAKIRGSR